MTTPDDIQALRRRIIEQSPDPARDTDEMDRAAFRALAQDRGAELSPEPPELRVRMAGPGVVGNQISVSVATDLLDGLQEAVTAIGRAVRRNRAAPLPSTGGRRPGVAEITQLRLSAEIAPGSVVFFLAGQAERVTGNESPELTSTETFLDTTLRELFSVVSAAELDEPTETGSLTESIRRLGADAAARLNRLAERSLTSDIELDLGWRNPVGQRASASLRRRGAMALKDAIDRNREQTDEVTLTGVLRTVSDGSDRLRMWLESGRAIRLSVDPDVGAAMGGMLRHRVRAVAEQRTVWHLHTGQEERTYKLISAEDLGPAEEELF